MHVFSAAVRSVSRVVNTGCRWASRERCSEEYILSTLPSAMTLRTTDFSWNLELCERCCRDRPRASSGSTLAADRAAPLSSVGPPTASEISSMWPPSSERQVKQPKSLGTGSLMVSRRMPP